MEKEKIYVVTTCIMNREEHLEITNNFIQATKDIKLAIQTMEELIEEVEENYENNCLAYSEDDWENGNNKTMEITREDCLEVITIYVKELEVE